MSSKKHMALIFCSFVINIAHAMPSTSYFVSFDDVPTPQGDYKKDIVIHKTTFTSDKQIVTYQSLLNYPIEDPLRFETQDTLYLLTEKFMREYPKSTFKNNRMTMDLMVNIRFENNASIMTDKVFPQFWRKIYFEKELMAGKKVYDYLFTGTTDNNALIKALEKLPADKITFGDDAYCWRSTTSYESMPHILFTDSKEDSIKGMTPSKLHRMANTDPAFKTKFLTQVIDQGNWHGKQWYITNEKKDYLGSQESSAMVFARDGMHFGHYVAEGKQTLQNQFCDLSKQQADFIANALKMMLKNEKTEANAQP